MLKVFVAVGTTLLLAGCATSPVPQSERKPVPVDRLYALQAKPNVDFGTLVVTRDSGFIGSGCFVGFYVDGQLAGKFETGETATFHATPGEHLVGVGNPGGAGLCSFGEGHRREVATMVKAGETKHFRLVIRPGDGPAVEPTTLR